MSQPFSIYHTVRCLQLDAFLCGVKECICTVHTAEGDQNRAARTVAALILGPLGVFFCGEKT
jgi:hypothetical protein